MSDAYLTNTGRRGYLNDIAFRTDARKGSATATRSTAQIEKCLYYKNCGWVGWEREGRQWCKYRS
ncbi:hypothetical protein SERLADRAFT_383593 [Serpula lacrymans var. lacrymans S7.9]|uniref:Uncharacterized protein n=1 Tax=Serpula lacrymans var. lacrymans (strain S7.9) TaxID=578457 RepID=F8NMF7_SERL9|nr:uncharacterized protein SERLADRAFT_383593 [Serpula lacrymans var. lacrymans S7.9]EGO27891.1 hypothetical protein SERLADRAFT_383593 [Serpula lacrymans var. lacrymans S7.9]